MLNKLRPYQKSIRKELHALKKTSANTSFEKKAVRQVCNLACNGKLIRGSLVLHIASLHGKTPSPRLGAAYEILHTGLLIHDDIIDKDDIRRGQRSIRNVYAEQNTQEYGDNQAICVGDIAFFYGFELLLGTLPTQKKNLLQPLLTWFRSTGGGQMLDIDITSRDTVTQEEILNMYIYKTAHYTFTAPLQLGFQYHKDRQYLKKDIENIGKELGLLFQLQDDYLAYTPQENTGKPQYNDVIEGKKTVIRRLIENENEETKNIYGKSDLEEEDKKIVKEAFENIEEEYKEILYKKKSDVIHTIKTSDLDDELTTQFETLATYLCKRKK